MFCSMCSDLPQPGTFAYEAFNKLPQLPKGGISQLIGQGGQSGFNNLPSQFNNYGIGGSGQGSRSVDINKFINNVPSESVKGNDSNLKEMIDGKNDVVIKKVLKSNYNDLIKKHQKDGGKWTDPDFPP